MLVVGFVLFLGVFVFMTTIAALLFFEGVVSKETVVLRRWGSSIQKFGFINGVDNVNWPPYRISVWWPIYIINSVDKTKLLFFELFNLNMFLLDKPQSTPTPCLFHSPTPKSNEFDSSRTNTESLKITEEKVLPL